MSASLIRFAVKQSLNSWTLIKPRIAIGFFELIQLCHLIANCFLLDFMFLGTFLTTLHQVFFSYNSN